MSIIESAFHTDAQLLRFDVCGSDGNGRLMGRGSRRLQATSADKV